MWLQFFGKYLVMDICPLLPEKYGNIRIFYCLKIFPEFESGEQLVNLSL